MGKQWDGLGSRPEDAYRWHLAWAREAFRVLRPGGYILAFGGTRTVHRLACAIEDAGFECRDLLSWIHAQGFPKGRANLKPAHEPIVLARKPGPLRALNIEECRIGTGADKDDQRWYEWQRGESVLDQASGMYQPGKTPPRPPQTLGRWPSNLLLSDPELFDVANPGVVGSGAVTDDGVAVERNGGGGSIFRATRTMPAREDQGYGGAGGYSRFYIIPKATRADREPSITPEASGGGLSPDLASNGEDTTASEFLAAGRRNTHPTVKPTDLMRHLIRLVTPQGGTVLDCFLGSGSTAIACELEGFPWLGIEQDPGYVAIAEARLNGVQRGMGLDVPAPTSKRNASTGHWPKERTPGKDGWGFSGQTGLEERFDRPVEDVAK